MPGIIAHKGNSLSEVVNHQWITTEGVFGIALGVSTGFVFLFVLFGALLDKAGTGNYFIHVAFLLMGHLRGEPAQAAMVSSDMTGLISGSSIANVVTHALLPAVIPISRWFTSSHLEAMKADMESLPRSYVPKPWMQRLIGFAFGVAVVAAISFAT